MTSGTLFDILLYLVIITSIFFILRKTKFGLIVFIVTTVWLCYNGIIAHIEFNEIPMRVNDFGPPVALTFKILLYAVVALAFSIVWWAIFRNKNFEAANKAKK